MAGTPKFHSDMKMLSKLPEDMIWAMIEGGKSLTEICIEMGISRKALERWIDENDPDGDKIARARARAADELVTETLSIADRSDPEHAAHTRVRIQARQWVAERWNRKAYGTQSGPQININVQDLRMNALRHVEVVEDLSTEVTPKLSTD
jgi:hypothetical protein